VKYACFPILFLLILSGFSVAYAQKRIDGGSLQSVILCDGDSVLTSGDNFFGQLGDGTNLNKNIPVKVNLANVRAVAAGYFHTLAIAADSTVLSWGDNQNGQLGNATNNPSTVPLPVAVLDSVIAIEGGFFHSVALKDDGYVWTWGKGSDGQLGTGNLASTNVPVLVPNLSDIVAISAVGYHTMALRKDSTVWVWGSNLYGQIGDGTNDTAKVPTQVFGLTDVVAISASGYHSVAVKSDGTVWAWGYNLEGQLGDGTKFLANLPVQMIGVTGIVEVAAGCHHTLMRKSTGEILAVGRNSAYGMLGDGSTTDTSLAVAVFGISSAVKIGCGCWHSMAVLTNGDMMVWGRNDEGALGIGNNIHQFLPILNTNTCKITFSNSLAGYLVNKNPPVCAGTCTGSATVSATGGLPPYSWLWDPSAGNQVTPTATGLCAGIYSVVVTDSAGASDTISVTINSPAAVLFQFINIVQNPCNGDSSASLKLLVSGGNPPFSFLWDNGDTADSTQGLPAGPCCVEVTDSFGCLDTSCITITDPAAIAIILNSSPADPDTCNGSIFAIPSGGSPPYSYLWDSAASMQTTAFAAGLCPGFFCVAVTDSNGCLTDTCGIEITVPVANNVNIPVLNIYPNPATQVIHISISGQPDGEIILMDAQGAVVMKMELERDNALDIGNLSRGMYLLQISAGARIRNCRILVI